MKIAPVRVHILNEAEFPVPGHFLTIYNVMPTSSSNGLWDARGDHYCSQWPPTENWSCYDMTGDGTQLTFIAAGGKVWPVTILPAQATEQ